MIYSHKPQRSGRSIACNTNNPPQDPPPPPKIDTLNDTVTPPLDTVTPPHISEIPDIFIEDTTPPVPEVCIEEEPIIEIPEKKIVPIEKKIVPIEKKIVPIEKKIVPIEKKIPIPKHIPKVSLFRRFIAKILRIFGRK